MCRPTIGGHAGVTTWCSGGGWVGVRFPYKKALPGTKMYVSTLLALGEGGWLSDFPEKSITKMYGSMLLALGGVGGCQISLKKALRRCTIQCY